MTTTRGKVLPVWSTHYISTSKVGGRTILSTGGGKTIIHLLLFSVHTIADSEGEETGVELHYVRSGLLGFDKQILEEDTVRVPRGPRQNVVLSQTMNAAGPLQQRADRT